MDASGLIVYHQSEKGEKGEARVENLKELISACREYEIGDDTNDQGDANTLAAFLDHAALEAGDTQAQEDEDCVQLMTLHSAKGLEFPVVFIAGVEEGLFPSMRSVEDLDRMEEERRLAYVGITRAMKKLFLTYAESRRIYGSENIHTPSRFLREIPPNCLQEIRASAGITRPVAAIRARAPVDNGTPYHLGRSVSHPKFGDGVIIGCEGQGPNARVHINFAPPTGEKWLVAQYARLELR